MLSSPRRKRRLARTRLGQLCFGAAHNFFYAKVYIKENRGCSPAPIAVVSVHAVMLTLIQTCRLHDVDPQAWLADVLARINDHAIHRLDELLPWNWSAELERRKVAA